MDQQRLALCAELKDLLQKLDELGTKSNAAQMEFTKLHSKIMVIVHKLEDLDR